MSFSSLLRRALFGSSPRVARAKTVRYATLRLEGLEERALLTAGALDPTFGTGGTVNNNAISATAAVQQPDGKLVVVSWGNQVSRFNANGSLDSTFGSGGVADANLPGGNGCHAIALQPDGKILVGGDAGTDGYAGDFAVARLNADGTLDTAFGISGRAVVNVSTYQGDQTEWVTSLVVQSDGKIVVGGYAEVFNPAVGFSEDFALVRFTGAGAVDTTYGTGGKVITDFDRGTEERLHGLALQADGKIVAAGYTGSRATASYDFALTRYNTNGTLDTSFDRDGKVTTDFGSPPNRKGKVLSPSADFANGVAIQTDGKIVVVGSTSWTQATGWGNFALARYNANGTLDTNFGIGGKVTTDFGTNWETATSVAIQTIAGQTKIVVGGHTDNGSRGDFALARYNTNGSLDTNFDGDGKVTTDVNPATAFDYLYGLVIQEDGKIVAVGGSALARFDSV